jgi:hypothetical protein
MVRPRLARLLAVAPSQLGTSVRCSRPAGVPAGRGGNGLDLTDERLTSSDRLLAAGRNPRVRGVPALSVVRGNLTRTEEEDL